VKLIQSFEVARPVHEVWAFLDDPRSVAGCLPGVEEVEVRGPDDIDVRVTQSIGPMTATFAAAATITLREVGKRIEFSTTGKTVRGAMGNVRAAVVVELAPTAAGTRVTVDGDVALAGALGSVGQKVVAKQAGKVTAQFAANLARELGTETVAATAGAIASGAPAPRAPDVSDSTRLLAAASLGLSAATLLVSVLTYRWLRKALG
jgi:carbon monoxide dehydrogenase subunit G